MMTEAQLDEWIQQIVARAREGGLSDAVIQAALLEAAEELREALS